MKIFDRSRVEAVCGPTTVYHIVSEIIPWVFFLLTGIVLAAFWGKIPQEVPTNTDFSGNITDWSDKSSLLWLLGVYFVVNLTLWIIGYFPGAWNNGVRVNVMSRRQHKVSNYPLTRDMLCDLRISMSLLFGGLLLWSAFCEGAYSFAVFALVGVCVIVPLARYVIRLSSLN